MAAKIMIEPVFEADFEASSFGFRPKNSATEALEAIRIAGNQGHDFVVDADIKGYFDSIDQEKLMVLVGERISERRVLKLIRQWLKAGVMEDGTVRETLAGTPQGGVISPLLANIYLHLLDRLWAKKCGSLGYSPKATKRLRDCVREITDKRASGADVKQIIAKLTPVLRGWGNYFRTGTSSREFLKMDSFVYMRLLRWMYRRGGQRKTRRVRWSPQQFWGMGLYRLRGTVRYPAQAASVRSSVSRVRENRTHGLKGVC
jgi:retron-type reverse transcriptase